MRKTGCTDLLKVSCWVLRQCMSVMQIEFFGSVDVLYMCYFSTFELNKTFVEKSGGWEGEGRGREALLLVESEEKELALHRPIHKDACVT